MPKNREQSSNRDKADNDDGILHFDPSQVLGKTGKTDQEAGGEILFGDFSRRPDDIPESVDSYRAEMRRVMTELTAPKNVNKREWGDAHNKAVDEIRRFLGSLVGRTSKAAYNEAVNSIAKLSNADLVRAVLDSSEIDWSTKPAYYKALAEEMELRARNPHETRQ